jgi:peptidylprolyl isomerase
MKKSFFIYVNLLITLILTACSSKKSINTAVSEKTVASNTQVNSTFQGNKSDEHIILITTTVGNIKLKLYNGTPLHRDNFLKLVSTHFFDSLLFHRVIPHFMVQAGDPDSKSAKAGVKLGDGDLKYTIPIELNPAYYHKRGALGAAREMDLLNPSKASSACQFYIVEGKVFTDSALQVVQAKRITKNKTYNRVITDPANKNLVDRYKKYMDTNPDSTKAINKEIDQLVNEQVASSPLHLFTSEQIKSYTTQGGSPHLDGSYTVFGEVTEGMDIVERIVNEPRDDNDRPFTNIRILRVDELK